MPFISSVRGSYGAQGRFGRKKLLGATSTGGTITTSGAYRIHTFQRALNGTSFTPDGEGVVEYLVVGGGAGGAQQHSGGGGAGGMLTGTLSVTGGTGYTITVGEGGAAQPNVGGCSSHTTPAGNGGQSQFSSVLAYGGGYPGCYNTVAPYGGPNGSGGGGRNTGPQPLTGGPGTAGQGYNGGASDINHVGGGGGGAGEAGFDGTYIVNNGDVRSGGNGLQSSISGTATFYAGGGGGGSHTHNRGMYGGNGGGGNGGKHNSGSAQASPGTDGLGGGGGGNGGCEPNHPGYPPGRGGHGVVIIRYQV